MRVGSDSTPTGGEWPARIWGQYMNQVHTGSERGAFLEPEPTRGGRNLTLPGERPERPRPPAADPSAPTTAPPTTAAPEPPPDVGD
jgi:hypothetical protein